MALATPQAEASGASPEGEGEAAARVRGSPRRRGARAGGGGSPRARVAARCPRIHARSPRRGVSRAPPRREQRQSSNGDRTEKQHRGWNLLAGERGGGARAAARGEKIQGLGWCWMNTVGFVCFFFFRFATLPCALRCRARTLGRPAPEGPAHAPFFREKNRLCCDYKLEWGGAARKAWLAIMQGS